MAAIDVKIGHNRIRILACHWTAQFGDHQSRTRQILAAHLSAHIYDFLRESDVGQRRHVLVLGDFNEEPFEDSLGQWLWASRSRAQACSPPHHSDAAQKRVHLYNAAWRLLGEQRGFDGIAARDVAGTTYWAAKRKWATFDQVIVSGSLLSTQPPYLDEASLSVLGSNATLADEAEPEKFNVNPQTGQASGVSDHLPIVGRVVLRKSE